MSTLFIDTSYNQTIGLLGNEGTWTARKTLDGQKSSSILHAELHALLLAVDQKPADITDVLYVAGPGFYTGLRIAHGLADMLRIEGRALRNFYNFEIPHLLGVNDYTWVTKAYRGEIFVYKSGETFLLSEKDFLARNWDGAVYIHHSSALDAVMNAKIPHAIATETLMFDRIKDISQMIKQTPQVRDLYYFRPPEEEFKPSV